MKKHYLLLFEELGGNAEAIISIMEYFGAEKVKQVGKDIRSECILHRGDNRTAFSYDLEKRVWSCFSHNCGQGTRRDLYSFVRLALQKVKAREPTVEEIVTTVIKACGLPYSVDDIDTIDREEINSYIDNIRFARDYKALVSLGQIKLEHLNEDILAEFRKIVPFYLKKRGLKKETIDLFEVGFSPKGINEKGLWRDFPGRVIVPIRDHNGQLVGLSGRLATDRKFLLDKYGKYRHMLNFQKGGVLYNLHRALPYIKQQEGTVIITEGFFDVMRLWELGVYNVVAIMGNSMSRQQVILLMPYVNKVYLALDGDEGGRLGVENISRQLRGLCRVYVIDFEEGSDPGNLKSEEEFSRLYKKARKVV